MDAKINRSEIMKQAHYLRKEMKMTMSAALKQVWYVIKYQIEEAKRNAARLAQYAKWEAEGEAKRQAQILANKSRNTQYASMDSYYANGAYSGD